MNMPGPGDSITWGRVTDPRDPRYDSSAEDEEIEGLEYICEEAERVIKQARALIAEGRIKAAAKLLEPLEGVI